MQGITGLGYEVIYEPLVPSGGINNHQRAAELLKEFGRNGDTYIVHAAEGETVLPMEVLNQNPRLKKMIWKQLTDMGIEPERYVVGNKLNSINPVTGQPEFFIKSVFKSLKRTAKRVAKVAKKVAPIALAVAAPFMLPMLPVAASVGIGSLAGNLIAGRSFKDSLKSAVIAGGIAGVGNMAFREGSFFGSPANPTGGIGDITAQSFKPTFGGIPAPTGQQLVSQAVKSGTFPTDPSLYGAGVADPIGAGIQQQIQQQSAGNIFSDTLKAFTPGEEYGVGDLYKEYVSPSRASIQPSPEAVGQEAARIAQQDISAAQTLNQTFKNAGLPEATIDTSKIYTAAVEKAKENLAPSMITKYGPATGATMLGLNVLDTAMGGQIMGQPEMDAVSSEPEVTGFDLYKEDPAKYGFSSANFYGTNPFYQNQMFQMPRTVKQGGEIVGPGTGTSDSIPAMLSDGEFVMTAKAVEGAGNGDRSEGAKRMYAMMRKFEGSRA
tara:strand:+ start:176 stop:1651 length:1476 start_codon:yes stop_codon:yes gene_type:complete